MQNNNKNDPDNFFPPEINDNFLFQNWRMDLVVQRKLRRILEVKQ